MSIMINGQRVPFYNDRTGMVRHCKIFQDWIKVIDSRFIVKSLTVDSVDVVGPVGARRVLFVKLYADVTDKQGNKLPGIVFLRGGTVAVFFVLYCGLDIYTILVKQPRFAIGRFNSLSIPAGMLDGNGNFAGMGAKEVFEETGVEVHANQLFDLVHMVHGNKFPGAYPSAGASDEYIKLMLCRQNVKPEWIKAVQGRSCGNAAEGEYTQVEVLRMSDLIRTTTDMKALSAYALWDHLYNSSSEFRPPIIQNRITTAS